MSLPDIRDVPCGSCQVGYNGPHECDAPRHCPCDRTHLHPAPVAAVRRPPALMDDRRKKRRRRLERSINALRLEVAPSIVDDVQQSVNHVLDDDLQVEAELRVQLDEALDVLRVIQTAVENEAPNALITIKVHYEKILGKR